MPKRVNKVKADFQAGIKYDDTTVFGSLLESDLPPIEKSDQRLTDEATSLLGAGTETVSWTMTVITYYLLSRPEMLGRLTKEVSKIFEKSEQAPSWATLEKLPYLSSVIHEGLRLSYGVASRTSRIATEEDLVYRGDWFPKGSRSPVKAEYVLPRGYAIGMSNVITHHDEGVFPESHSFIPQRWLDEDNQHRKQLDRALLSFGKGSRACVGMKYVTLSIPSVA